MSTTLSQDERILRLEDILKAMIDGDPRYVRAGRTRTPRDTVNEILDFSDRIAEERRDPQEGPEDAK